MSNMPKLPEPYLSPEVTASLLGPNVTEPLFTAEQMRAQAAAVAAPLAVALENLLYWDNGKSEWEEARAALVAFKEKA